VEIILYAMTAGAICLNLVIRWYNNSNPKQAGDDFIGEIIQSLSTAAAIILIIASIIDVLMRS